MAHHGHPRTRTQRLQRTSNPSHDSSADPTRVRADYDDNANRRVAPFVGHNAAFAHDDRERRSVLPQTAHPAKRVRPPRPSMLPTRRHFLFSSSKSNPGPRASEEARVREGQPQAKVREGQPQATRSARLLPRAPWPLARVVGNGHQHDIGIQELATPSPPLFLRPPQVDATCFRRNEDKPPANTTAGDETSSLMKSPRLRT
ncbi:hypothetical protein K438DRAFT_1969910 [Mycena galopus ATCC 62051]|nr:hypothetical protein K438DRAFT_1969910 [Mycena galopus ATCC 62051]